MAQAGLNIQRFVLGSMMTNTYLVTNEETGRCFLVDPSCREQYLIGKIRDGGAQPEMILLTHGHFDHIGAVEAIRGQFGIPVYAMKAEEGTLKDPHANLTDEFLKAPLSISADRYLEDNEVFTCAGLEVTALLTPGHTPGGGCYYIPSEKLLFSGDTLFRESVGRSDFPGGDTLALLRSLRGKLMILDPQTRVLPGHGPETTIAHEKECNPFV